MRAWVVRAGENAASWPVFRDRSIVGIDYDWAESHLDIRQLDRPSILAAAREVRADRPEGYLRNMTAQTWIFLHELRVDDLVVVPRERGHVLAFGRVRDECERNALDEGPPYVRSVEWIATDVSVSALATDLRHSLGSITTVFAPKAPGATERLASIAAGNADPGPADFPVGDRVGAWVFQCDPDRYELLAAIARSPISDWSMNQGRRRVSIDDRIWFRITGRHAGIYATGRVRSLPRRREDPTEFGQWEVDVEFEALIEPPLLQPEIAVDSLLSARTALRGLMGTNLVIDQEADERLAGLLEDRMRPLAVVVPESRRKEDAINRSIVEHRKAVLAEIRGSFFDLTPDEFERLGALVLERMGFEDVQVVGASTMRTFGDQGVDIVAQIDQPGLPNLSVGVQVKRQAANVGPDAIQKLRGALKSGEHGIFITAGRFTQRAREEATAMGRSPVGLLDGDDLAQRIVEFGLGVRSEPVALARFEPAALQALVASGES